MLRTKNLCISRGARRIVENLDLTVPNSHFLVVAGPNGAGKTTLLRALSGEIPPDEGCILLDEKPLSSYSQHVLARRRAFLAQQTECRLPFRAVEIVRLGAEAVGHRGRFAESIAGKSLEKVGISHLANRIISQLSGGEQQRVHWARILAQISDNQSSHCLFLDEPVSSLDLAHQHELLKMAKALARSGSSIIAVLHDLNLAAQYADTILLLCNGRMFKHGIPKEVLTNETISSVFGVHTHIAINPVDGSPWVFVSE